MSEENPPEEDPGAPSRPAEERDTVDPLAVLAASVVRTRRELGSTLSAVAARAGVSSAYVSQMESGAANPTVRTLGHVAAALGTTPARLLDPGGSRAAQEQPAFAARFTPSPLLARTAGHRGIWDLSAHHDARLAVRLLHADIADHAAPITHGGEEFVMVLGGSCRVVVAGAGRLLRVGDAVHLAASDPHHFVDPSDDLLMLVVLTEE
ncbi:helix-turn-helix domain-containing protein [Streptomyces sp. NPDC058700]|uniref:helix-turn-helix domain-containing protein n=1 Tax=Streptomyces sp. NPDC058700 TaxID=3346607 RepID=UPI003668A26E